MTINSVFSVDDFSDTFWASTPAMNRSTSEWALEQFLEEFSAPETANPPRASVADSLTASSVASSPLASQSPSPKHQEGDDEVVEIKKPLPSPLNPPSATAAVDSDEYRAFLKNQLDLACAAVAFTRELSPVKRGDSANVAQSQLVAPKPSQVGLAANENGTDEVYRVVQNEADGGPLGVPAFPSIGKKTGPPSKQTTSGSSREDSDDDDLEGDIEITDDMDPADAKRARRMLSNRESARRSRRRKQAQMNDLESQVSQLRVEHSTLLKTLTDINQKYDTAAVDNRILKADIETLRAKVKMAEERVKRATGFNPLLLSMPNVAATGLPAVNSMMGASNAAVSMHRNPNQLFHQPVAGMANASPHRQRLDSNFLSNPKVSLVGNPQNEVAPQSNVGGSKMAEISSSIQHTGRLADLQKQIGPGVNPRVSLPAWDDEVSLAAAKNKKNVP